MEQYTAWMADLIGSKDYAISDRNDIQSHIDGVCAVLNRIFEPSLARPLDFSAGDDLQALFRTPTAAYCCARLYRMLLLPARVRTGIGAGSWDVRMPDAGTTAQDGQAYHRARAAIDLAGEQDACQLLFCSGTDADPYVNFAMDTAIRLTEHMTDSQNELMLLAELTYPVTVENAMRLDRLEELAEVMRRRARYGFFSKDEKRDLFSAPLQVVSPVYAQTQNPKLYFSGGKQRGMPTVLAQLAGVSRQSVEKTLKTAGIYSARNAAIVALRLLLQIERSAR